MLKSPYLALYFAAAFALLYVVQNITGGDPGVTTFITVVPMLFGFVGMSLERLQKENRDLQKQIDELKSQQPATNDETDNGD